MDTTLPHSRTRPVTLDRRVVGVERSGFATREPHPALVGLVTRIAGFDQHVRAGAVHLGLPTTSLPLMISFGFEQTIASNDPAVGANEVGSFAAGVQQNLVRITATRFHGMQLDLTPLGAVRLLGRPIAELEDRCVPLHDLFGRADVDELAERLLAAPTWQARLDLLEGELIRRLHASAGDANVVHVRAEVAWALQRLVATGGLVGIQELSRELGWSRRHLTGRFAATFGVPPKRMGRLIRFERVTEALEQATRPDLATLAATAGFSDQAHLSRDVKTFSGLTPSELAVRYGPDDGWWET